MHLLGWAVNKTDDFFGQRVARENAATAAAGLAARRHEQSTVHDYLVEQLGPRRTPAGGGQAEVVSATQG